MKNKNVVSEKLKIESVTEYLERGGKITIVRESNRNRNRTNAKPKLYNRRKHSPRPTFLPNPIF